jgi:SAM-dependent methyltransferase
MAGLRPGEVVVDLGSGGGLDVLLAAQQVGPTGKAIGIDMTSDMIDRARRGAERVGATNVEFHLSEIESLPLADDSIDCVISNCVLNLVPDKARAFREILRVLKPGGRLAVSDIALKQALPEELGQDLMAYVGCIAGAVLIDDYERQLREAGFDAVEIIDSGADLNAYALIEGEASCDNTMAPDTATPNDASLPVLAAEAAGCCGGSTGTATLTAELADLLRRYNVNDYAASVRVFAVKPLAP